MDHLGRGRGVPWRVFHRIWARNLKNALEGWDWFVGGALAPLIRVPHRAAVARAR